VKSQTGPVWRQVREIVAVARGKQKRRIRTAYSQRFNAELAVVIFAVAAKDCMVAGYRWVAGAGMTLLWGDRVRFAAHWCCNLRTLAREILRTRMGHPDSGGP
jgi:hypothetical protein